jgi:hypothetical protein
MVENNAEGHIQAAKVPRGTRILPPTYMPDEYAGRTKVPINELRALVALAVRK